MSGQSLGDILGEALKKKEPTLVERAAARNIVVNGMGTSVPSHREAAVSVVEATFEFVPNDRGCFAKINSIKALRDNDRTLTLKEGKDFVEGDNLNGFFENAAAVHDYVKRANDALRGYTNTGQIQVILMARNYIYV